MSLRRIVQAAVLTVLCALATGCRHKTKVIPVPAPPPTTVPLAPTPEPSTPPQVPSKPVTPAPLPTKSVPKVKKPKKKVEPPPVVQAPAPAPPVQMASVTPPPVASVIGSLTAGGDADPAQQQKAADAIAAVEKRLAVVPADKLKSEEDGVNRVRNFLRQAHEALNSHDAEGASTLATKARVLLDDLLK